MWKFIIFRTILATSYSCIKGTYCSSVRKKGFGYVVASLGKLGGEVPYEKLVNNEYNKKDM